MNKHDQKITWKEVAPLNENRHAMGGAVFLDTLVVAGGHNGLADLHSVEFYQATLNKWEMATSLRTPRSGCALVASNEYVYVLGGWNIDGECLSCVERNCNLNANWEEFKPMQMPRRWLTAVMCGGFIYAIGGQTNSKHNTQTNTVEKYEFDEEKWVYVSSMNTERSSHAACVLNRKIYVVGGLDATGEAINTIECFDPITDSWTVVGNTDYELYMHSLTML